LSPSNTGAVGLGVPADPAFGFSLRPVTPWRSPRAEAAELTMVIGWCMGVAHSKDNPVLLEAGRRTLSTVLEDRPA
jgi:hypothetical protein